MPRPLLRLAALFAMAVVTASTAATEIEWYSLEGAGVMDMTGDDLALSGTVGQAWSATVSGEDFVLSTGFWAVTKLPIPGDVDGDGDVDFNDLLIVLSSWGDCPGCPADLDGDGEVGFVDLLTVLSGWTD